MTSNMKMTLLEMVQNILSAMESDDVNSISDTPEGEMVADIIKEVYYQTVAEFSTPDLATAFFTLEGLGDTSKPNYMKLPDDVEEIYWLKYNSRKVGDTVDKYNKLTYCAPEEFFDWTARRDETETIVDVITTDGGIPLNIYNDRAPSRWTQIDNEYIIFDAFDSAVDTTLQASKSVAGGRRVPAFTISDTFVPDLDSRLFPYLLAEAKAVSFVNVKQEANPKQEQISRRQKVNSQNSKTRFQELNKNNLVLQGSPNFGRK